MLEIQDGVVEVSVRQLSVDRSGRTSDGFEQSGGISYSGTPGVARAIGQYAGNRSDFLQPSEDAQLVARMRYDQGGMRHVCPGRCGVHGRRLQVNPSSHRRYRISSCSTVAIIGFATTAAESLQRIELGTEGVLDGVSEGTEPFEGILRSD